MLNYSASRDNEKNEDGNLSNQNSISYKQKFYKLNEIYLKRLERIDAIYQQRLENERKVIINSWRWWVGGLVMFPFVLIRRLVFRFSNFFSSIVSYRKTIKQGVATLDDHLANRWLNSDKQIPRLACVFDIFSYHCFNPEFKIYRPTPSNWKELLKNHKFDALLCESAWRGNEGAWRLHFGKLGEKKEDSLAEIVYTFKSKGIPTIFWNKEDPVNFEHFIDDAKNFDYIFTTDESIIPKYREYVKHGKVLSLPFAAQELIHNPIKTEQRISKTCFAGSYYNHKYAERIIDLEMVLKPAMEYGLDIYDRNYGAKGVEKQWYSFPQVYQPLIKGKLEYNEMVEAYKRYKVFLNINSVRYSSTMLSRRVFELLASGTPVISTYSEAIHNLLGEDTVIMVETEEETSYQIEKLLKDERYWWKRSLNGLRKVLENHTYNHRTKEIFDTVGIDFQLKPEPQFLIITKITTSHDLNYLKSILNNQVYTNFEILIVNKSESTENVLTFSEIEQVLSSMKVKVFRDEPQIFSSAFIHDSAFTHVVFFDLNNYYGSNYLRDYANATKYSEAKIFGKHSCHNFTNNGLKHINSGIDFQYTNSLIASSLVIERETFFDMEILQMEGSTFFTNNSIKMLSIDPYNFIIDGQKASSSVQAMFTF